MENNYIFWNEYLKETLGKMKKMMQEKDVIYTDFHMHSDYSADGKQSLVQIIERMKNMKMDITTNN